MIAKTRKITAAELQAILANSSKAAFENAIEDTSGTSFSESGITMPSDEFWRRCAAEALMIFSATELDRFTVGDNTMQMVFKPAGLTNVHDLQAVLDAVEAALVRMSATAIITAFQYQGVSLPLRLSDDDTGVILDDDGVDFATVDVNNERPDDQATAIALLIVSAVNSLADMEATPFAGSSPSSSGIGNETS